ncbi:hypothetical protein Gbro_0132 [Gordonia bronchialis DSM 43247]|uniref:Uncharacterized protein n=1 Tax=Gordonia bronchialis (strain ATCC 25592 / DSM 43247 / BCRC 13721 / JCM 3198 / KCTC 3076 / NBRC 16047 / NCTC 10667) TaxID=526226 RepID=D0LB49_GORB4|nr:hypothetical protein [Gordonia bronchialis]ACY19480.1 hypothetical protein Gbro_0132 [Gordonia bronchialis DSM 43247]MCC3322261.1 hypothetical protein [Gordonia bronchialis]QGS26589.1 hypothetical protein FOB84_23170 [Gordonia bronchialis]STQ62239.1 Uncharacterised protein [Gordonia bronchialis]
MRVRHRLRLLAVLVALGLGGGLTLVGLGQAVATPGDVKTRVNNYWEARVYQAYDIGGAFQLTNKASQRPIYLQYKRTSRYGWPSGWHRLTGDVARGQTKVDGWYVAPRGYDGVFLRVCRNDPGDRDYCWSSLMYFGKPGGQGGGSGMITGA